MIACNMTRAQVEEQGHKGVQTIKETDSTRLVRVLNGFDLFVLKDDISLTPSLTEHGFWEAWITSWLTRWLRPGMTFLDIGANCGYYSFLADRLVGKYGNVVAYEPNPVYAELLRQSRNVNDAGFKVRTAALGDKVGSVNLTVPADSHGSASIVNDFSEFDKTRVYEVPMTTLDSELLNITFFRHDIIKIDAEGAEEKIWNGGNRIWDCNDHTTIMFEYTPGAYSEGFLDELYKWGSITAILYDGSEGPVSKGWINSLTDWQMLVVRKR